MHEAVASGRVSSGSRVLGEAGWRKYPPLERAKDTQLLRAKPKGKGKQWEMKRGIPKRSMDGSWMDGVMVKLPRRVGFGANYKVDAWGHTTPCIGQPLRPSFPCKIVFLVRKRWCRAVKPSLQLVIA